MREIDKNKKTQRSFTILFEIEIWQKLLKIKELYKFNSMKKTIEHIIDKFEIPEKLVEVAH